MKERTRQWLLREYWQKCSFLGQWLVKVKLAMVHGLGGRIEPRASCLPSDDTFRVAKRIVDKFLAERGYLKSEEVSK